MEEGFEYGENNVFGSWIRAFLSLQLQRKLDPSLGDQGKVSADDQWPDILVVNFQELVDLESVFYFLVDDI